MTKPIARALALAVAVAALPAAAAAQTYEARITYVYDGDTVTADLDLGLDVVLAAQRLRLQCVDTPELRGEERPDGLRVRDVVREWLSDGAAVVEIDGRGKYGRWLAFVTPAGWDETLNERLVREGMAEVPDYAGDCEEVAE